MYKRNYYSVTLVGILFNNENYNTVEKKCVVFEV